MALVTVQRSPSPSDTPDALSSDVGDGLLDVDSLGRSLQRSRNLRLHFLMLVFRSQARRRFRKCLTGIRFVSRLRLSESYVSFKGAALILPQSECLRTVTKGTNTDIHTHLQSMFYLLRPQDTIKMAIKLESLVEDLSRYVAVVSTLGVQDTEESVIVGVDIQIQEATIGLVLPVWADMSIKLDGDGGFSVTTIQKQHIFKPVSVQAMWSAWQCLNKVHDLARSHSYYTTGLTHTWVQYYKITSPQICINEWNIMEDLESQRPEFLGSDKSSDMEMLELRIRAKLKEIMMTVDLEETTSLYLRKRLEEALDMDLKPYKTFIDQEMIVIMRQMDSPSQIFDFLYLGSEWNASNLDELHKNKIGYILNVTREIDNFFPGLFTYKNIRVFDVDESDLLKYWEETYRFICKARKNKSRVLVHCKMGVSRSASSVISFAMKDNTWSLEEAYKYVKGKRSVIRPNDGFMKQLKTYEGILEASNQRHSQLWRSRSTGNLQPTPEEEEEELYKGTDLAHPPPSSFATFRNDSLPTLVRPQSWSPKDDAADILLKAHGLASREESSDESIDLSDDDEDDEPIQFMMEGDVESSSQSIDDCDEAFHDYVTENRDGPPPAPVTLLGRRERREEFEPEPGKVDSDLESEDGVQSEGESKHVFGGYNVDMLGAVQDEAFKVTVKECEDAEGCDGVWWSALRLHPDMIVEQTLVRYRKHQMVSRLMQLHKKTKQQASPPQVIVSQSIKNTASNGALSAPVRVKPDDFWIKDEQPSICQDPDVATETCDTTDETTVSTSHSLSQSAPSGTDFSPVGSTCSDVSESIPAYIKEAIPWSPGTVRRHAQDLEGRMTTSDIPVMSDLSSSPQSHARPTSGIAFPDSDSQSAHTTTTPSESRPDEPVSVFTSEPLSSHSGYQSDSASTASTSLDDSPLHSPSHSPQDGRTRTSSHIYESEDISLEPGHVLRTKLEIETRERSSSYNEMSPDKETHQVQRSSSCKDNRRTTPHSRFDRSSERRKTCLPVLNPSPLVEKSFSLSQSNEDISLQVPRPTSVEGIDAAQAIVTYNIGTEEVEIEEGKVKRQTRDFEGVTVEVTGATPKTSEPDGQCEAVTVESTIALDEGEVLIRQGSVKRTKQDMLQKYADGSKVGTTSKESSGTDESRDTTPRKEEVEKLNLDCSGGYQRKLKHSQSSPQLYIGAPAYPTEEDISWSVGTVQQHKECYELIEKNIDRADSEERRRFKSSLSDETLILIRQVGTAWLESPRPKSINTDSELSSGPGMVRRLADQIQGQSASLQIERKLRKLKEKGLVKNLDFSDSDSDSPFKSSMPRSASMRENSPRQQDSSVGRSSSLRDRISPRKDLSSKDSSNLQDNAESAEHLVSSSTAKTTTESADLNSMVTDVTVEGVKRTSSIKEARKLFEGPKLDNTVSKSHVTRTNSNGTRAKTPEGSPQSVFKSSCNVAIKTAANVSPSVKGNSSDLNTCEESPSKISQSLLSRSPMSKESSHAVGKRSSNSVAKSTQSQHGKNSKNQLNKSENNSNQAGKILSVSPKKSEQFGKAPEMSPSAVSLTKSSSLKSKIPSEQSSKKLSSSPQNKLSKDSGTQSRSVESSGKVSSDQKTSRGPKISESPASQKIVAVSKSPTKLVSSSPVKRSKSLVTEGTSSSGQVKETPPKVKFPASPSSRGSPGSVHEMLADKAASDIQEKEGIADPLCNTASSNDKKLNAKTSCVHVSVCKSVSSPVDSKSQVKSGVTENVFGVGNGKASLALDKDGVLTLGGESSEVESSMAVEGNVKGLMDLFEGPKQEGVGIQKDSCGIDSTKVLCVKSGDDTRQRSNSNPAKVDAGTDEGNNESGVVLNPSIKQEAIKTLFSKQDDGGDKSIHRAGVKGTRRHRRSTLGLVRDRTSDTSSSNTGAKNEPRAIPSGSSSSQKSVLSSAAGGHEPEASREPPRVRKLHGKSHPLSRLTQEAANEDE